MKRYFIWYIKNDGVKYRYVGYPEWLPKSYVPEDVLTSISCNGRKANFFKSRSEAERIAALMRQDNRFFVKVWVTQHNA